MKKLLLILLFLTNIFANAQTPGTIYQRVQGELGQKVLDPNNDGFISLTSSGFSGTDFGVNSELRMIPLPVIQGEPHSDLTTGSSGGHTDIVSALVGGVASRESAYILYKTVDGIPYVIIRMRIGKASTSPKGYSFLLNTDGSFLTGSTNANPGYDKEIVLQTGNGAVVAVYTHNGATTTLNETFLATNYAQRAIAFSTTNGDADYFYDFFIPFSALGITNNPVGITAVTVTSAGSGITGTISDFNGVDDRLYGGDRNLIMSALISSFPAIPITDLTEDFNYETLYKPKTLAPVVNEGIVKSGTSISGISSEADGTVITVYKDGVSIGTATVTSNAWTLSNALGFGLLGGNLITATALASNKTASDVSNTIVVSSSTQECFIVAPTIGTDRSAQTIRGTFSGTVATTTSIRIQLYTQTGSNPADIIAFNPSTGGPSFYVALDGTWLINTQLTNSTFINTNFIAKAISSTCESGYSNVSKKSSGQVGTITPTPSVTTSPIYQSSSSLTVTVSNNGVSAVAAILILYVNGIEVSRTPSTIAINATYDLPVAGLSEGDVVSARAQSTLVDYWISNVSNLVTVQLNTPTQTLAPKITGTYTAGSGKTITGTSTEATGTEIKVYKGGSTLLGTTTVTSFGTWQITNQTLATSDVLTATAKALNKSLSVNSNSVTVQASAPLAPTVSGSYVAGNTSISGASGNTLVRVYVDGSLIGTATPTTGNWTLSGLSTTELYRGAVIHATNIVNGIESVISNTVTVTGVVSFCITDENGNPLENKISGQAFNVKITAKSASGCGAGNFTSFTSNANLSSNKWFDPSGPSSNFTSGELTLLNVVLGGVGSATITAISPNDPTVTGSATITITKPAVWVGGTSTDFSLAANWLDNIVPGPNASVRFASVALDLVDAVNNCNLDSNRIIGDLDFNSSSYKLNLNGKKLELRGSISNSNSSTGSWISNATSELEVKGYGNTGTLHFATLSEILNLTLNNTSSGELTLGSSLSIRGVLNVVNGSFKAGTSLLTFKSNDIKTAVVAPVTGSIIGDVIVENYIPARRAFRFLSPSVTTSTSINANWQEGATNPNTTSGNVNPNLGYGTHITGNGINGLDATQTTNFSMYTYNNTGTLGWAQVTSTTTGTSLVAGKAYRILIRGNRSTDLNNNSAAATATTLRARGTLFVGDFLIPDTALNQTTNGFSFIGNPYQSKVNIKEVLKGSGFQTNVWYWNSNVGSRGAFVPVDFSLASDIEPIGAGNSRIVSPGASFFVRKVGGSASSIVFKESHKVAETSNPSLFRQNQSEFTTINKINITLHENNNVLPATNILDGALLVFNSEYSNDLNSDDVVKFSNSDEDLAVYYGANRVSIDKRNFPTSQEVINLGITKFRYTNYNFKFNLTDYIGITPYLFDQYLNTYTVLTPGSNSSYSFGIDAQNALTTSTERFKIVFQNGTLNTPEFNSQVVLYPNPGATGITSFYIEGYSEAEVSVYTLLGQKIPVQTNYNGTRLEVISKVGLSKGIYLVKVITNGGKTNHVKWVIE